MNDKEEICVLHILSSDDGYGSAKSLMDLLEVELKNGIRPVVITPRNNRVNLFCRKNDIRNYSIQYEQFQVPKHNNFVLFTFKFLIHLLRYCLLNKKACEKIKNIAVCENIDVVHSNSSVIDIGGAICQKLKVPHIWHIREYGKEDFNFYSMRRHYIDYMNASATAFICISKAVANSWMLKGLDKKKISIISHGINVSEYKKKIDYRNDGILNVVMVGSFSKGKGQILLLEALKNMDEEHRNKLQVHFYGKNEGDYYKAFYRFASENHLLKQIKMEGYSNQIQKILCKYDVGVICSKSEAMGRATLEYMACGLCPVVSNAGANIEIVKNNECGFVFELNDPSSLSKCLIDLIDHRNLVELYGRRSCKIVDEMYDSSLNDLRIIELFRKCLTSGEETCI